MSNPESDFEYSGTDNLEVMLEARNYNRFLTDQVVGNRVGKGTVLDFGAGIGSFAERVRDRGIEVHCLEPDECQAALLNSKKFETFTAAEEIASGSYDYIYSLNVFEHIEDDAAAARQVFRILKPGGAIYIYVPAFALLFGSMDRKVGHYRRYRRRELRELVGKAGLVPGSSAYVDCVGFFATLAYNLKPGGDGTPGNSSIRLYDRFLFPASRLIDRATSSFIGKNVFVTARKPARQTA